MNDHVGDDSVTTWMRRMSDDCDGDDDETRKRKINVEDHQFYSYTFTI